MALDERKIRRKGSRHKLAESTSPNATEDNAFRDLWTHHCFYTEDNPPDLQSPTMRVLYTEYRRRIIVMIGRAKNGEHWQKQASFAVQTLRLGEWIYPEVRPTGSDDELLVRLANYGHTVRRAREIVNETHRRHRPPDPRVRRESIRAYDLHLSGCTPSQIAKRLYRRECKPGRTYGLHNVVEKVRHRLKKVKNLFADLDLSVPSAN